uniref:Extended FMRFamide-12 n=1 Tax=Namaquaphasma ookiepense TaxID=409167 RepID=FAR12_NAMOO|nr:RecName: Full=Extended FMRFamide-12; Short=FMRFa-12 [Namaquaphasma ookiepense]
SPSLDDERNDNFVRL